MLKTVLCYDSASEWPEEGSTSSLVFQHLGPDWWPCLGRLEMGALTLAARGARRCACCSQASWMHTSSVRTNKAGKKWYWHTATETRGQWSMGKSQQPRSGGKAHWNQGLGGGELWGFGEKGECHQLSWISCKSEPLLSEKEQDRDSFLHWPLDFSWAEGFRAAASLAPLVDHPGEVNFSLLIFRVH